MKRLWVTGITALLVMGLMLAASIGVWAKAPTLRIGLMPDVNSLIYLIAEQEGLFAQEGIDVELVKFKSAAMRDSALQAGEIDGAVSDVLAAFFALNGGLEVRITSVTEGRYALLAAKDSGIASPEGFVGKQIAISKNTIIEYATDQILKAHGVAPEQVKKVAIPQVPVRMQMLAAGKITGACLPDPLATAAEVSGATALSDSSSVHITPSVMVWRKDRLNEKRAMMKGLVAAYDKVAERINGSSTEQWYGALSEMGFPEETWSKIQLPVYRPSQPPARADVEQVYKWMKEKKLVDGHWSYDEIVDLSWLQ